MLKGSGYAPGEGAGGVRGPGSMRRASFEGDMVAHPPPWNPLDDVWFALAAPEKWLKLQAVIWTFFFITLKPRVE